jgi:hypothetical protein
MIRLVVTCVSEVWTLSESYENSLAMGGGGGRRILRRIFGAIKENSV